MGQASTTQIAFSAGQSEAAKRPLGPIKHSYRKLTSPNKTIVSNENGSDKQVPVLILVEIIIVLLRIKTGY